MAISTISTHPKSKISKIQKLIKIHHFYPLCEPYFPIYRSEGFPNGIFHPCTLWARALARWKNCRRAVAVAVAVVGVIWKMPKYMKIDTFSKIGMSEISRNVNLAEIKAPAGAT